VKPANQQEMRSYDAWAKSLQNFEWLSESVPGATDLDIFIERRGSFLVIETKAWQDNGIRVPFGQYLALKALSELDEFDVYLVGEVDGDPNKFYVLNLSDREPTKVRTSPVWFKTKQFQRTTKDGLAALVQGWYETASAA
jgi:hypothetical protein